MLKIRINKKKKESKIGDFSETKRLNHTEKLYEDF